MRKINSTKGQTTILKYLFLLLIFFSQILYSNDIHKSIDNSSDNQSWLKMYPLNNNSKWIYACYFPGGGLIGCRIVSTLNDTIIDSKKYVKIMTQGEYSGSIFYHYERIDTLTSYIYTRLFDKEERYLKLNVSYSDTFQSDIPFSDCGNDSDCCCWEVVDTSYNIFGKIVQYYWNYLITSTYTLNENVGLLEGWEEGGGHFTLKGCYVDGKVYGDTSTTSIDVHQSGIMNECFELNAYPNPFNPVTTIEYKIPNKTDVFLSIYDIQGRLIENLVNQNQSAGTYSIEWNASNYCSGVYFCKIQTDGFQQTKKVILIK